MKAIVACALVAACGGGANALPAGAQVGPALAAALTAADQARAPWRCAAADGPELASETLSTGTHAWKLAGHTLARDGAGEVVIGAIADAGGAAPTTVAALGRLRDKLAKADLVLALGGMGTTEAELVATLGAIAPAGGDFVLVALPGDLEDAGALARAVAALRARGQAVVDGRLVQRVELGGAAIAVVPGTSARGRLVAGDEGCSYAAADVPRAIAALAGAKGIRVLASHEAPRGVRVGEPTGDLAITATEGVDVALHGPVVEAASRARQGGRDGDAIAVTPGTADATPRLPDPTRRPTAGLLVIRGDSWSWKPLADE